ncbi:uncharacterized protein LOC122313758 isoform X4 [Carya illinoinensis]|uniref:uncharacterized protein LOC122313758 isoform X4 n=1 Tax=Carya illinoinensis TaxID=32201 RepID=UPI001C71C68B|nr:uncharacterized protein LOC122313758 isoform X4 [Carya illinoinensis]
MGLPNPIAQVGGYVCGSVCVYLVRTCMILVEAVQVFKHANVGVSVCIFGAHVHAWYWLKLYNFFKHVSVGMGGCKLVGEHVFRHLHVHVCRGSLGNTQQIYHSSVNVHVLTIARHTTHMQYTCSMSYTFTVNCINDSTHSACWSISR